MGKKKKKPKTPGKKKEKEKSGLGTPCSGHKDCKSLEAPFCKLTGEDDEGEATGECARCSECLQCSDGVEGSCGFRCQRIWPRWSFPLEGIEDECTPKEIEVNCEVCGDWVMLMDAQYVGAMRMVRSLVRLIRSALRRI